MSRDFHSPLRQSPWAILFILWHYGRIMVRQLWPLLLIIFVQPAKNQNGYGFYVILGVLVITLISAVINHFFFSFWVDEDTFYIKEGWLRKKNKTIPIDRIQSLNVEQTLLHRITHTGKVLVETAGSAKAEVEIRAIHMDIVEELQTRLFKRAVYPSQRSRHPKPQEAEAPLFTLGFLDLIKIGLSQNHLRTIGVVLAFSIGFLDDLENQWGILPEGKLEEMGEAFQSMMVLTTLGAILTIGVIIASVIRILLSHADLALFVQGQRFRLNAGLLTIRETVVTKRKLQSLTWSANPIQRLFGIFSLKFSQATTDSPEGRQQVTIPGLYSDHLQSILHLVFPSEQRNAGAWSPIEPRYFWKRWIGTGIIPAAAMALSGAFLDFSLWLPALIWVMTSALFAWKMTKRWQWYLNRDMLILKRGWLTRETTLLPVFKIQSLSLHQTPIQRWYELVTVTLHTAAGTESIPYLSLETAENLQRYVLFRIESDDRSWM